MVANSLFKQTDIIAKALEVSDLRNQVIMSNISNVDTPNYKKRSVTFESAFQNALDSQKFSTQLNLDNVKPQIQVEHGNYSMRLDGNNIDIEIEMTELYKNSLKYDVMVNSIVSNTQRMSLVLNSR